MDEITMNDEIKCYDLSGEKMAKIIHKGPYEASGPVYERLFAWIFEVKKMAASLGMSLHCHSALDEVILHGDRFAILNEALHITCDCVPGHLYGLFHGLSVGDASGK
jgi:hypothetical protein